MKLIISIICGLTMGFGGVIFDIYIPHMLVGFFIGVIFIAILDSI